VQFTLALGQTDAACKVEELRFRAHAVESRIQLEKDDVSRTPNNWGIRIRQACVSVTTPLSCGTTTFDSGFQLLAGQHCELCNV